MKFEPFPKVPRWQRDIVITEKIDGANASVHVVHIDEIGGRYTPKDVTRDPPIVAVVNDDYAILAASRTRWLDTSSKGDSFGFAKWVRDNADELFTLGPGSHFGEWWGQGIQRKYNQDRKRFSLFNTHRWSENRPSCCDVVPVLYRGPLSSKVIEAVLWGLERGGSFAAPGFMKPEGIMIYHTAANQMFKKTIEKDELPKGLAK